MKSFVVFAAILLVATCLDAPNIWPLPKEYKYGDKTLSINTGKFRFHTTQTSNELMEAFQRYYAIMFDRRSAPVEGEALWNVEVEVEEGKTELQLGVDESYTLEISEDGATAVISAKNIFGAMHGIETFSQLVEFDSDSMTYVLHNAPWSIKDEPRFPHRGILMDTSRHYESLPSIKKLIDSMRG